MSMSSSNNESRSGSGSSSRDTSPDPIVLPSSPLGNNRSARKPTPRRLSRKSLTTTRQKSPSKSIVLDTPGGGKGGGDSPWRIRVTVEAEPSPGRKRRSTSPIKKSTTSSTANSIMQTVPLKVESPAKGDMSGNTRKRKGTPIRRGRSTRHQPPPPPLPPTSAPAMETVESDQDGDLVLQDSSMPPPAFRPSASRRTSGRIGRLNSQSAPTLRSQRLSLAREELDIALQDAVGYGEEHTLLGEVDFSKSTRMMGDATLGRNEDFSMISVETLQTAKDSSGLLGNSVGSASGYSNMASSPPKREEMRRSVLGNPVQFGRRSTLGQHVQFGSSQSREEGNGSALSQSRRSTTSQSAASGNRSALASPLEFGSGSGSSANRNGADVMSWRPTGPPVVVRHETPSSQLKPDVSLRRSTTSHPQQAPTSYGTDGANDEDISQGIDLDIWQDEASRSLEEQPEEAENAEQEEQEEDEEMDHQSEDEDELHAQDQLQSDAAAQSAKRSPGFQDLFADQPLKPARGKIPRTWRRSSGMDFSYVDSPAHGLVEGTNEPAEDERRHSTDEGGVLTPPSTSDEEGDEEGVENAVDDGDSRRTGEDDDEMEYEEESDELGTGQSNYDNQPNEDHDEPQSEWNQPDAEATRYEGQLDEVGMNDDKARNDSVSPLSEGNTDDEDTGSFFQSNMPAVYARQNRPRRPPPRPRRDEGTVDLTDLLGLKSSPVKPAAPSKAPDERVASSSGNRAARTPQLYDRSAIKMKLDAPPQQDGSGGNSKLINSPLRKSLLKGSKLHGGSPDQKRQLQHHQIQAPAPAMKSFIVPAQRQQVHRQRHVPQRHVPHSREEAKDPTPAALSPAVLDRSQTRFPNSQSKVEVELDSFASKDSDQRQLLEEMTPRVGTGVGQSHTGQSYDDESEGPSSPAPIMRSYEEKLNVDSPQKIPVHFGDSSSVLPPTKLYLSQAGRKSVSGNHYRPERQPPQQSQGQNQPLAPKPVPVVDRRGDPGKGVGGILSRLSETFWSAVIRPTGPTEIMPETHTPTEEKIRPQQQQKQTPPQQQDEIYTSTEFTTSNMEEGDESTETTEMFNPTLRTAIRNRYGVLPSTFPWTMAHMRTLHRMLNSLLSTRPDSLIPNAGPLPALLMEIVETQQESVTPGKPFLFTREHAYVVFSFMQVLVEEELVRAMERGEVEMLGDETSKRFRGVLEGDSRRGGERVFRKRRGDEGRFGEVDGGVIGWEFVVGALGCVVWCEGEGRGG